MFWLERRKDFFILFLFYFRIGANVFDHRHQHSTNLLHRIKEMSSRQSEIEAKRARIAELKRQREEKRSRQAVALGGTVSTFMFFFSYTPSRSFSPDSIKIHNSNGCNCIEITGSNCDIGPSAGN